MNKYVYFSVIVTLLFVGLSVSPAKAATNTTTYYQYQYQTQSQQLAALYAIIAQLQTQLAALQTYQPVTNPYTYTNNSYSTSADISRIATGGVVADGRDSVSFDGDITFRQRGTARVWFEYGLSTNLTYSTKSIEISGRAGASEDFDITATDFDNRTYYYRAVAEDDSGRYVEGPVKSFRFDSRNDYYYDNDRNYNNDRNNNDDWSLEVDDDYYERGDMVRVEYTVDTVDNRNWIGLYEVGDSNNNYVSFKYIRNRNGYEDFRVNQEGEFEFRLFSDDGFNFEARSDRFEVDN